MGNGLVLRGLIAEGEDFDLVNGYLIIEDGRISEIGEGKPWISHVNTGALLIPAPVNAHVHTADYMLKDCYEGRSHPELVDPGGLKHQFLEKSSERKIERSILSSIKEAIVSGCSALADFREGGVRGLRIASRVKDKLKRSELSDFKYIVLGRLDGGSIEDIMSLYPSVLDGLGIPSPPLNEREIGTLRRLSTRIRERGGIVHIHAGEREDVRKKFLDEIGISEVEAAIKIDPDAIVHATRARDDEIEEISKRSIGVVLCASSNLKLGLGTPPLAELVDNEVTLALGSDNSMINPPNIFRELENLYIISRGLGVSLDPREMLRMVTQNACRLLKLEEHIIEEGKPARILGISLSGNALKFSRNELLSVVTRLETSDLKFLLLGNQLIEFSSRDREKKILRF